MHVRSCGATPEPRAVQRRARTGNPLPFVALPSTSQLNRHVQKLLRAAEQWCSGERW